jgi:16S rRNA (cytosine967-C5)-methyltransferase
MTAAICEANQTQSPTYVRINKLHKSVPKFDFKRDLGDGFFEVESLPYEAIKTGAVYVQDPSTAIAPTMLAPTPSLSVLDMCAAPGGKTAIMAQLMRNDGRIVATDASAKRITRLTENIERLGIINVTPICHDWLKNPRGPKENKKFDRILIDVPCSNTGVMRRRVDVRWRLKPEDFVSLGVTQKQLLETSLTLLNPGGIVVYSTCSIDAEENENMIKQILDAHRELSVVEKKQTFPHRDGIDGSFAAALKMA